MKNLTYLLLFSLLLTACGDQKPKEKATAELNPNQCVEITTILYNHGLLRRGMEYVNYHGDIYRVGEACNQQINEFLDTHSRKLGAEDEE